MQSFRNLATNIFFKIFLAFIALAFVLFGVSGFILNGPEVWVAKVGDKTITQRTFLKEVEKNHRIISQTNQSKEATAYLNSPRFKSDVTNRMVNDIVISKLREDLGIHASEDLILKQVAKDDNFKGLNGKFDRGIFKKFLAKNGLNQKEYVDLIKNEVAAALVIQSITAASPANEPFAIASEEFRKQTRLADVVTISNQNIKKVAAPNNAAINAFYDENKQKYAAPQLREVSYITFSKDDILDDVTISDEAIEAEYAKNQKQFQTPETRDLYHVAFKTEAEAATFARKLDAASNLKTSFVTLAKDIAGKDKKEITLEGFAHKDLMPELSNVIFKMALGQHSTAVKSPLGFHVFLLNKITPGGVMDLEDVRDDIEAALIAQEESKNVQEKISQIDDSILTSNSLEKTADQFDLDLSDSVVIAANGKGQNGQDIAEIQSLEGFAVNAFALENNDASKLFYSKSNDIFYAVQIDEIQEAHNRELTEVKSTVKADLTRKLQAEKLQKFAEKVRGDIAKNPSKVRSIAAKYRLKIDKNKSFPRTFYVNYQGRQIPYASPFLTALFSLEVGQVTGLNPQGADAFTLGVVKKVNTPTLSDEEITAANTQYEDSFRKNIAQTYNNFVMKKHPIALNEQFFANQAQQ